MTRTEDLSLEVKRSAEAQRSLAKSLASGARVEPDPMRAAERQVTSY
ncbi:MAG: hypothetical protein ABIQ10_02305 [Gemmatimonadaceae bacterium]